MRADQAAGEIACSANAGYDQADRALRVGLGKRGKRQKKACGRDDGKQSVQMFACEHGYVLRPLI
jgi:hypothetical protein